MSDRGLLELFARGGEPSEAAFASLVERHGQMVLRVCRDVLADSHLAEDAFQVTFLLLARRARSIYDPAAVAGWLHHVARRVALRARAGLHRRRDVEALPTDQVAVATADPLERDEKCAVVHEEIDRLADVQRLPILLCALEGLSHEEAAARLGWPLGTVKSRLVRGRRRLQYRLSRRGLAPALTLVAGVADSSKAAAPLPLVLAVATTRAALKASAGPTTTAAPLSASIVLLLQRELRSFVLAKIRLAAGVGLTGAAAILIGISLTGPIFGRAQRIVPVGEEAPASAEIAPSVARSVRTIAPANASGIPANPSKIQDADPGIRPVAVPERRLSAFGKDVSRNPRRCPVPEAQQRPDGSWTEVEADAKSGVTSLVVFALLAADEKPDSPAIHKALELLRRFAPDELGSTYAISLQTMAMAAGDPERNRSHIKANVAWLQRAQIKPGAAQPWPGTWSYSQPNRNRPGDNSNTQYALLGLAAASEAGFPIDPSVWQRTHDYWELCQQREGNWAYTPDAKATTASMTCAGISSLAASRPRSVRAESSRFLKALTVHKCDGGGADAHLQRGIDWLANHFNVDQNFGAGKQWRYYYLYGLERRRAPHGHSVLRRARLVSPGGRGAG